MHIVAVAFIHRFGSSLNEHVHFHVCAVDGVFEEVAGEEGDAADAASQSSPSRIIFHPATGVTADAVGQVQASLRKRILRAFVGRGLLESFEAQEMLGYKHSGFSVDTSVCIAAHDRAGLERLLRYCARPPFAMERLRKAGSELVYRCAKQHSEPGSLPHNKRGVKADEITLTPLELIERIAKLVPPPRTHRHRYFGVLAPNSPLRPAVTALARDAAVKPAQVQAEPASTAAGEGALGVRSPLPTQTEPAQPVPPKRPAHYLWAVLMAALSLLPAVGAGLVWVPVALYLFAVDQVWQGAALVAWGVLVIGLADNVLRPLLVGKDTGMPDYLVLITTLGGIAVMGINGFVIGPTIAAMFVAVWHIQTTTRQTIPPHKPMVFAPPPDPDAVDTVSPPAPTPAP